MAAGHLSTCYSSFQYCQHAASPYLVQQRHNVTSQCPQRLVPFAGAHSSVDPNWYPDTGATHHMTALPVCNPRPYNGPHNVYMGNGDSMSVSHTGNLPMSLGSSTFSLQNVFRIPSIQKNLLSVARFTKDNLVFFLFAPDFYQIYCLRTGRLLFQGPCQDGLYPLHLSSESSVPHALSSVHSSIWHHRLGHPSSSVLARVGSTLGSKISFNSFCSNCALSKSHQLPFPSNHIAASSLFSVIHSDVWMSPVLSFTGFKYYVLFTDEYSRYTWVYPMRRKNEVLSHFQKLVAMIKTIFHGSVQHLQSDNGTEYVNKAFTQFCDSLGIQQRFSCPYTPQQNGLAERKHRHIANTVRTLLLTSGAPQHLWADAVITSVYLINLLPTPTINWDTPHTRLYGSHPSYSSLRVFGCSCFPHLGSYVSNKLSSRSIECVFIGYSPQHKGYRCLDPKTNRVYISRHVIFNENDFPYNRSQVTSNSAPIEFVSLSVPLQPQLPSPRSSSSDPGPNTSGPSPTTLSDSSLASLPTPEPQCVNLISSSTPALPQPLPVESTAGASLISKQSVPNSSVSEQHAIAPTDPPSSAPELPVQSAVARSSQFGVSPPTIQSSAAPLLVVTPPSGSNPPPITYHRRRQQSTAVTEQQQVQSRSSSSPTVVFPGAPLLSNTDPPHVPPAPADVAPASPPHIQAPSTHAMRTRLRDGITQPRIRTDGIVRYPIPKALLTMIDSVEPTCYSQASKKVEWRHAMVEEINALLKNDTWSLVPPAPSQNTVGCKWVFRVKRNPDGSVDRFKARLVAKGFHQQHGIDFHETFSPVIKPATIRTVISIAVSRGWSLRQLDVKNAFLHGFLTEEVYMTQPPGFVDPSRPTHVCKLQKALYGLKQAPRAWFQRMHSFLISVGFRQSLADSSLFIFNHGQHIIYFLLYVDDILLTGSNDRLLQSFIATLGSGFDIKDLGPLHYFLGLQVHQFSHGVHLNQVKYAHDLLSKHDMLLSKPVSTPMSAKDTLTANPGSLLDNPTEFRALVGALQYLTITRPDIAFAVNSVSQYMSQPSLSHLVAVKRILRYVKGTLGHGLYFAPQRQPVHLSAYSDADWAGCPDSRRSTSGYLVYLGSNLISWCSKKQPTIARSSAESEYRSLAHACAETTWLGYLLYELGARVQFPILLHCDNLSATYMASNPVFHARTKHIELDYHYVREKVALGSHRVCFIPSIDQPADLLTKPLHKTRHFLLSNKLVRPEPPSLRGDVRQTQSSPKTEPSDSPSIKNS